MLEPEALLAVKPPEVTAMEGDDLPGPPWTNQTMELQNNCLANPLKLSGNVLPVRIGCITVNAVLDMGAYTSMISRDFYNKICIFQPEVTMNKFKRTRMKDANSNLFFQRERLSSKLKFGIVFCLLPARW